MFIVPEGQSSPVLTHASGHLIMISWSEPTISNGVVSEYQIQRRSDLDISNISSVARISANSSTRYLDNGVIPCVRYYYRVIAFTKAGGGTPSPWSNITTREGGNELTLYKSVLRIIKFNGHISHKWEIIIFFRKVC